MSKSILKLSIILIIQLVSYLSFSQNYIRLDKLMGAIVEQKNIDSLEFYSSKVVDLITNIEEAGEFKVFDYGFYLHEESFSRGAPAAFEIAKAKAASISSQYILFGRQIDRANGSIKLWIDFKFNTEDYSCMDEDAISSSLQSTANQKVNDIAYKLLNIYIPEKEILKLLYDKLLQDFCCSDFYNNESSRHKEEYRSGESCLHLDLIQSAKSSLIDNEDYIRILKYLKAIYDFYKKCDNEEWKSEVKDGIVPKCVWEDIEIDTLFYYGPLDVPFNSGRIDGTYAFIKGLLTFIFDLPGLADKGVKTFNNLLYSYTIYYVKCTENNGGLGHGQLTKLDYYNLMGEIHTSTWTNQENKTVFDDIYDTFVEGAKKTVELILPDVDCDALRKTRKTIEILGILVSNKVFTENLIFQQLCKVADEIWQNVNGFGNEERYYHGYYGMQVVLLFVPIADIVDVGSIASKTVSSVAKVISEMKIPYLTKFRSFLSAREFTVIAKNSWYQNLKIEEKILFNLDFLTDFNYKVLRLIRKEHLGDAWKFLLHDEISRKNINILKSFKNALNRGVKSLDEVTSYAKNLDSRFTSYTVRHLFRGDRGGGRHHISAIINDVRRQIRKITNLTEEGFYEVEFTTGGKKSFWPNEWDEFKVLDEIKYVLENKTDLELIRENTYLGKSNSGQYIGIYINTEGKVISAFPVFDIIKFKNK